MISILPLPSAVRSADVGAGGRMAAHPSNDHTIQSRVGLTIAAAVEPVARGLAARGGNGTGAAQFGKGCFRANALGIVAHQDQHLGRRSSRHAMSLLQRRGAGGGQSIEIGIVALDLSIKRQPTPGQSTQGCFGRGCRGGHRSRAQRCQMPDQRHFAGDRPQGFHAGQPER